MAILIFLHSWIMEAVICALYEMERKALAFNTPISAGTSKSSPRPTSA
jgi:hypothetical protein